MGPRNLPVSTSLAVGSQARVAVPSFFTRVLEDRLKSSCLEGMHLTDRAISLALTLLICVAPEASACAQSTLVEGPKREAGKLE